MTDEDRRRIAALAVRRAEREELKAGKNWKITIWKDKDGGMSTEGHDARPGEVFIESPDLGRREIMDHLVELIVERDEWRRRAMKHGCGGQDDEDCG